MSSGEFDFVLRQKEREDTTPDAHALESFLIARYKIDEWTRAGDVVVTWNDCFWCDDDRVGIKRGGGDIGSREVKPVKEKDE